MLVRLTKKEVRYGQKNFVAEDKLLGGGDPRRIVGNPNVFSEPGSEDLRDRGDGLGGDFRYALAVGAALMLGWTFLLIWADRKPVERRGVLLLTIFPVKVGLDLANIYLFVYGYVTVKGMFPSWILSFSLYVLFIYSYVNSRSLVAKKG
jgi:hypothetical protein